MSMKNATRTVRRPGRSILSALTLAAACTLSAPAMAAGPQGGPAPQGGPGGMQGKAQSNPQLQRLKELRDEARSLGQQLGQIRQKAIENNESLQAQQKEFRANMKAAMKEDGYDPEGDYDRLLEIQKKLKQGGQGMEREQRMGLVQEFREKQMNLQKAEQKAMKDEGLQKQRQDLIEATQTAMKEQDPKAEKLMQRFEEIRQEIQQLRKEAFAGMQKKMPQKSAN